MPDGGTLVTEIGGIRGSTRSGRTASSVWAVQAPDRHIRPTRNGSGHGRNSSSPTTDAPGSIVRSMTRVGTGSSGATGRRSGPGELAFPVAGSDVAERARRGERRRPAPCRGDRSARPTAIVWQYGHTDVAGSSSAGYLHEAGRDGLPPLRGRDPGAAGSRIPHRPSRVGRRVRLKLRVEPPRIEGARADVAQLVEHHLAKVGVAGSNPVVRSKRSAGQLVRTACRVLTRFGQGASG